MSLFSKKREIKKEVQLKGYKVPLKDPLYQFKTIRLTPVMPFLLTS